MARRKVTAANLVEAIRAELEAYGEDVTENMREVTRIVAKKGAQAVKNEANAKFDSHGKSPGERYGAGWKYYVSDKRLQATATIYNDTYPTLPHLLEHGHAKRGGGRVEGRPHIEPVEKQLIEEYERSLRVRIEE